MNYQHFKGRDILLSDLLFNMELEGKEMIVQKTCLYGLEMA